MTVSPIEAAKGCFLHFCSNSVIRDAPCGFLNLTSFEIVRVRYFVIFGNKCLSLDFFFCFCINVCQYLFDSCAFLVMLRDFSRVDTIFEFVF